MEVPDELASAWTAATEEDDPIRALRSLATLRSELTRYEAHLARHALGDGASWATIGEALGTSRQAAWERLRPAIKKLIDADRSKVVQQKAAVRDRRQPTTVSTKGTSDD